MVEVKRAWRVGLLAWALLCSACGSPIQQSEPADIVVAFEGTAA